MDPLHLFNENHRFMKQCQPRQRSCFQSYIDDFERETSDFQSLSTGRSGCLRTEFEATLKSADSTADLGVQQWDKSELNFSSSGQCRSDGESARTECASTLSRYSELLADHRQGDYMNSSAEKFQAFPRNYTTSISSSSSASQIADRCYSPGEIPLVSSGSGGELLAATVSPSVRRLQERIRVAAGSYRGRIMSSKEKSDIRDNLNRFAVWLADVCGRFQKTTGSCGAVRQQLVRFFDAA
uniref:DUF630 domain-containing protein n=1 Tax=Macrostomum lignano TaxID=282301 RepID=A0A1I8FL39_9PLAT